MSWAEIKKAINSDFINEPLDTKINRVEADTQDIQTKVNTINTNVGSNADSSSATGSVHAKLKDLKAFSNIKSIQTGHVVNDTLTTSTGEDVRYVDITISSVSTEKCVIFFDGGFGLNAGSTRAKSGSSDSWQATTRLTTATNLRISNTTTQSHVGGRWTVVEFN